MPKIQIKLREAVKHHRSWFSNVYRVVPAKSREELANMCLQAAEHIDQREKQLDECIHKLNELQIRVANAYDIFKE